LFVQGGGAGVHDDWDAALCDSLRRHLGAGAQVRYPRMADEDGPGFATWSQDIRSELGRLDDGAVVVGHSIGGTVLVQTLRVDSPACSLGMIVLIGAPFVGERGWPADGFEFSSELGAELPPGVPVHVFHGLEDDVVPPSHADLYAAAVPQAVVHRLPERDHQLGNDLHEVAALIR
jgi:predicted alpha/beta hydrolase family esterase